MGGSLEDAQEDAQRVVVIATGSPVADPVVNSAPTPPPAQAAEGKPELPAAAAAPLVEPKRKEVPQ
jgi:hypothetical protein